VRAALLRAQDGCTPLYSAAWSCHGSVVTLLLERGADKEAKAKVRTRRRCTFAALHILIS
jgi:hypothetical protein